MKRESTTDKLVYYPYPRDPHNEMWWKLKEYLTEHVRGEEVSLNKDFEETFRHVLAEMAMLETQYLQ